MKLSISPEAIQQYTFVGLMPRFRANSRTGSVYAYSSSTG
jgi:hypothetical protein